MIEKPLVELEYEEGKDGILYPKIQISKEKIADEIPLGKYGMMALNYLKENHESRYSWLMIEGELMSLMHKVDEEAKLKLEVIEKQMLKKDPVSNPMDTYESYRHRDMIRREAEEIVLKEIVYKVR
ncbi:TnpV protein [Proteiniborus sp. MB09-C3]|uniref:TnpV protein n=1 Tax=Proteiniborus sp. MB09-C3 TaxID=3050072 RepID=UPI0033213A40